MQGRLEILEHYMKVLLRLDTIKPHVHLQDSARLYATASHHLRHCATVSAGLHEQKPHAFAIVRAHHAQPQRLESQY